MLYVQLLSPTVQVAPSLSLDVAGRCNGEQEIATLLSVRKDFRAVFAPSMERSDFFEPERMFPREHTSKGKNSAFLPVALMSGIHHTYSQRKAQ